MSILWVLAGIISLAYGIYDTVKEINIFSKGKQDQLGADIKVLGADVSLIIIGLFLICEYI